MKIGTTALTNCKIGSVQVNEVRIGSTLVWSFSSFDPDAQAFITAAGITNTTQQNAINQLVLDLKSYSIWTKFKALYPFVGGTATTHKFNLKNPLDTDAAFRLVFSGGWVHSSTGALPNGTNAYADTFLIPLSNLSQNSTHISVYSRTNSISGVDIGVNLPFGLYLLSRFSSGFYHANNGLETNTGMAAPTTSLGLFLNNRIISSEMSVWQNGIEQTDSTSAAKTSYGLSNYKIFLGAYNQNGTSASVWSNRQQAFASIGEGLTDTEASNCYTAVQAFQTSLSRNV